MKVLILCGGLGTRAYPYTQRIPKALMPVAGLPVVEQVMRIYAAQGFDEFVLSGGYLIEQIQEYFELRSGWKVECINTGAQTDTAGRIRGCLGRLTDEFHATYCDGLGDVDLRALVAFHRSHGDGATMTTCPLRSQYGILYTDGEERVTHFDEKPMLRAYWINAGFFVFNRETFAGIEGSNLERDVLPQMAARGLLRVHRHDGFWRSMDTYKDQQELDRLWVPYSTQFGDAAPNGRGPLPAASAHARAAADESP